jgi:hypothetical protein
MTLYEQYMAEFRAEDAMRREWIALWKVVIMFPKQAA